MQRLVLQSVLAKGLLQKSSNRLLLIKELHQYVDHCQFWLGGRKRLFESKKKPHEVGNTIAVQRTFHQRLRMTRAKVSFSVAAALLASLL